MWLLAYHSTNGICSIFFHFFYSPVYSISVVTQAWHCNCVLKYPMVDNYYLVDSNLVNFLINSLLLLAD